jgi:hypothetical protein
MRTSAFVVGAKEEPCPTPVLPKRFRDLPLSNISLRECTHHLPGGARQCRVGAQHRCAPSASSEEGHRRSPHLQGRPGGTPPPRSGGGWVGAPLQKTPSSALSLPCEIVSISQGRPLLAPEFTQSGQEEAGKGLKIPVCGGSSLHATPFRQEAAVTLMPIGRGPPGLSTTGKLLHDKSCVHPLTEPASTTG